MALIITQQLVEALAYSIKTDYLSCSYIILNDCFTPPAPGVRPLALPDDPRMLEVHPLLHMSRLDDSYMVAFVPSLSRVAVLDLEAVDILQRLPLGEGRIDIAALETIEQLWNAGLLYTSSTPPSGASETQTLTAWLHITNACNLRCSYCYIAKSQEHMSIETGYAAVDAIIRSAQIHGYPDIFLKYAGGEASLALDTVAHVHRYAQEQAQKYGLRLAAGLLSNGVALTTARLAMIRDLGIRLMISLDGLTNVVQRQTMGGKDATHLALRGVEGAIAHGIIPDIAITVTAQNVHSLPALVGWLTERDLPFSISFYRDHGCHASAVQLRFEEQQLIDGMRDVYDQIAQRPPRWSVLSALLDRTDAAHGHSRGCAAGHSYLVVDHHGKIAKCQTQLDMPITTIADTDPLLTIRSNKAGMQSIPVQQKEGCRSCEWQSWCAGACAIATYRATGRYDVQSPNCQIYKALYPDLIRLEGQRLLYWHQVLTREG